jgi:hypothetical protein
VECSDNVKVITSALALNRALPDLSPSKVYEIVADVTGISLPTIRTIMGKCRRCTSLITAARATGPGKRRMRTCALSTHVPSVR